MATRPQEETAASAEAAALGPLPEWDLTDLYPGRDSAELSARPRRSEREADCLPRALRGQARRR